MQEFLTQLRRRIIPYPAQEKNTQQEKIYTRMNIVYKAVLTQ